jgi:putative tryptophan/tyrosine transport system substrate-binding protein
MKRREFVRLLGIGAARPIAALGQQVGPRILGVLGFGSLEEVRASYAPVQRRLAEMGYIEGQI